MMRNHRLLHPGLIFCLWCCVPQMVGAQDIKRASEQTPQKALPGVNVIVYSGSRQEGLLARRPIEEAQKKDERPPPAQTQNKLGGMRKGLFLAAAVTIVLVAFPLLGRLLSILRRAKKMRESMAPREHLPALQQKLAKGASAPTAAEPRDATQPAQRAKKLLPPILGDRPVGKYTPALPVHRPQRSSATPSSAHRKDQLLKTAALLSSAPLPMRLRLITNLEFLIDKLHRETVDKASGSPG